MTFSTRTQAFFLLTAGAVVAPGAAAQQAPTPGFPEAVVQWGAQKGETCADIANAIYGSPKFAHLLLRYNRISCASPMTESITLVVPAKATSMPAARLRSMHPDVQTRPASGAWQPGSSGQPLGANHNVKTQDQGRADIEFIDRTRVFLAPHTLVVIFDTASQTKVSKVVPPRVEVQEGEVRAGLAALRGAPVEVSVPGGGQVSAASRDTVIARKGERTTVAVFDGKAGVKSGGKSVEVPLNFGTRFVGQKPPDPPRPLPPAPVFQARTSGALTLDTEGQLTASWDPVPSALSYRIEVAREADFGAPIVREEVPADVTTFRAEKLPPGRYFLRVRATDKEEFLGVAATRSMTLVVASLKGAKLEGGRLLLRRGAQIELQAPPGVEVAADDGAFGPAPASLALPTPAPRRLKLRAEPGQPPVEIPVEFEALRGEVTSAPEGAGKLRVTLTPAGRSADEALAEGHPQARVTVNGQTSTVPLARLDDQRLGALIDVAPGDRVQVEVLDDTGVALGATSYKAERPATPLPPPPPARLLGAAAPLWAHQADAAPFWRAPRAHGGASVAALAIPGDAVGYQVDVRASGQLRRVGIDAALRTRASGSQATDGLAWAGLRLPIHLSDQLDIAPMLHGSFPTAAGGPSPSLEPAIALGGLQGTLSWAVDLGGRVRLANRDGQAEIARGQGFVVAGLALRPAPWFRAYATVDGRALASPPRGEALRAGGTVGIEAGTTWFGGAAVRGGLGEPGGQGAITTQLTLGLRDTFL